MSKTKTTTDLIASITELQNEVQSLRKLSALADKYTKMEFGYSVKELHEILRKHENFMRKAKEREATKQDEQL